MIALKASHFGKLYSPEQAVNALQGFGGGKWVSPRGLKFKTVPVSLGDCTYGFHRPVSASQRPCRNGQGNLTPLGLCRNAMGSDRHLP